MPNVEMVLRIRARATASWTDFLFRFIAPILLGLVTFVPLDWAIAFGIAYVFRRRHPYSELTYVEFRIWKAKLEMALMAILWPLIPASVFVLSGKSNTFSTAGTGPINISSSIYLFLYNGQGTGGLMLFFTQHAHSAEAIRNLHKSKREISPLYADSAAAIPELDKS
ncbi:MAG: hypothetical protein Q9208_007180 [Pyrenodesmia sp. 3 TL-2023]